jgi:hypothetical protein
MTSLERAFHAARARAEKAKAVPVFPGKPARFLLAPPDGRPFRDARPARSKVRASRILACF